MKICYYHSADLDGVCSGAIFKHYAKKEEDLLLPLDYNDYFDIVCKTVKDNKPEIVYFIDVCPTIDILKQLPCKVIIIDHHVTKYNEINSDTEWKPFEYIYSDKVAACLLSYRYFAGDVEIPYPIELLSLYDVWKHEDDDNVLPFQYGMRSIYSLDPEDGWSNLFSASYVRNFNIVNVIVNKGKMIIKWEDKKNKEMVQKYSWYGMFNGLKAVFYNGDGGSKIFDGIYDKDKHDLMILYKICNSDKIKVSLYTTHDHIHCGEIAQKYGGGGHAGAAGFIAKYSVI